MELKTILVTGSAGFIGFHLSKYLSKKGYNVIGIDNINDYYDVDLKINRLELLKKQNNYTFIKGDITDDHLLDQIFNDNNPSIVINLAAQAGVRYSIENPEIYFHSNIIGFFNLLEKCRKYKIRHLITASSSSVYGNQKKTPFEESDKIDEPISFYAATKKSNEEMGYSYSHIYGLPITALRFFTVYGPLGRPDMAYYKFADSIRLGKTIELYNYGNMLRDFTYIDDVVIIIEKLISTIPEKDGNGTPFEVYNIGKGSPDKLVDLVELIQYYFGKKVNIKLMPMQQGDVLQTYAGTKKLENAISYKPKIELDEGLSKFIEWYKGYYHMDS